VIIRSETAADHAAVFRVNSTAFPTDAEARLVNALRASAIPILSLVAERSGAVVGHILFSAVTLAGHPETLLMVLAPMAVEPQYQRQGIGRRLVEAGLAKCRAIQAAGVVVLGHPAYYPRFGFVAARQFGIACPYDVPDEVFMALELAPGALNAPSGTVQYHTAFAEV